MAFGSVFAKRNLADSRTEGGAFAQRGAIQRLQEIQNLDDGTRKTLFAIIDTFVRDAKARVAYQ
jgi:hypothetical protein